MKRDFLRLSDFTPAEHRQLFDRAHALKKARKAHQVVETLKGRTLVLFFEKASTRTRLSFSAAMFQLGGSAIDLPVSGSQVARGEPLVDTARVLAGYADVVAFRTFGDDRLAEMARACRVPVINALSDGGHPVQVLADLFTLEERLGEVRGKTLAFVGDGSSNMARSFVEAAPLFGFDLRLAAPVGYRPPPAELQAAGGRVQVTASPAEAVSGAHSVITDVWTSMGQEAETQARLKAFQGFCVDEALVARARPDTVVLHCLPAHRGEEISDAVMEGPRSAIFEEAENRLHVQKALLERLLVR